MSFRNLRETNLILAKRLRYAKHIRDASKRLTQNRNVIRSFTTTLRNQADSDNNDNNSSNNNSPRSSDGGSGYETDSNRSFYEEGADAMVSHPAGEIPEDHLRRYIKDTAEIMRYPEEAGIKGDEDPSNAGMRQE
jgi:hypothetical protein